MSNYTVNRFNKLKFAITTIVIARYGWPIPRSIRMLRKNRLRKKWRRSQ